jgi:hypothetical protein
VLLAAVQRSPLDLSSAVALANLAGAIRLVLWAA